MQLRAVVRPSKGWEKSGGATWPNRNFPDLLMALLPLWITVMILILQNRNFEISLLSSSITPGGFAGHPAHLQIYLLIERSVATKVFVVMVAVMNCEFLEPSNFRHSLCSVALSRAYRHRICHNLRSDHGISKSRNIFRDVRSPSWRFVCFLVHQIQSAWCPSWFRWDSFKFLERCPQTKHH